MFNNKNNKLFLKMVIAYLPMIIISSIIIVIIFIINSSTINNKIKQYSEERIEALKHVSDNSFKDMNTFAHTIFADELFVKISKEKRDLTKEEKFDCVQAFTYKYSKLILNSNIVKSYFIYLPNSDYILKYNAVLKTLSYYLSIENKNLSFDEYREFFRSSSSYTLREMPIINKADKNNIIYYSVSSNSQWQNNDIIVFFEIDKGFFKKISKASANISILDEDNNIILSNNGENELESELHYKVKSEVANIYYAYFLEDNLFVKGLKNSIIIIAIGFIIILLIIFVSAYFSAKVSYTPIKEINDLLPDDTGNDFMNLVSGVKKIINSNNKLRETVFGGSNRLNLTLFNEIINNEYNDFKIEELNRNGIILDNRNILITICKYESFGVFFDGHTTLKEIRKTLDFAIQNIVSELLGQAKLYLVYTEKNLILLVASEQEYNRKELDDTFSLLTNVFEDEFGIKLYVGVGNIVKNKASMIDSYNEAIDALKYLEISGSAGVIFYEDLLECTDDNFLFYSLEEQKSIERMILAGDEQSKGEIKKLFLKSMNKDNTSFSYVKSFMLAIQNLFAGVLYSFQANKLISTKEITLYYNKIVECFSIKELEKVTIKIVDELIQIAVEKNDNAQNHIVAQVKEYIDENYHLYDLSNVMLAEVCHVSSTYLSFIFKAETGQNLSSYISEYRIKKAIEFMDKTDMLIKDISVKCGISDTTTFNRLFKKYKGVPPSEYRKNLQDKL